MAGEAEAAAAILKTLFGEKQLGAPAAAPQFGGQGGGLLGQQSGPEGLMRILANAGQNPFMGGIEALQGQNPELFAKPQVATPVPTKNEQFGPPDELFESGPDKKAGIKGFLSQFGKGIDETLSSPSKQLGIGLLGQIDPRLSLAGLLAGGLFGGK